MIRSTTSAATAYLILTTIVPTEPTAAQNPEIPRPLRAAYDSAYFAWDRGDYPDALARAERILTSPGGEALLERIALLTGELFAVQELTTDGRLVRWSPDGRHAAYETGVPVAPRTRILTVGPAGARQIAEVEGSRAAFSPDGREVAYLSVPRSRELAALRATEARALERRDGSALAAARAEIAALEARLATIQVRDLGTGRERERRATGLDKLAIAYTGDGTLVIVGRASGRSEVTDLYALPETGSPRQITEGPGIKGATLLPAGRSQLVYTIGADRIGIVNVASRSGRTLSGRSPAVSADGSTLAFLDTARELERELRRGEAATGADGRGTGHLTALMVLPLAADGGGEPRVIKRTTLPLANPSLSPSGQRIAYNTVLRDDWEIFVIDADGARDRRLTREIQHDLFPRFLSEDRLLSVRGEARHRRAHLHDLDRDLVAESASMPIAGSDERTGTQLFHNNTVRTVAPQYEWSASPDGTRILVVADRDGDTLAPERGVYLVDLNLRVTGDEVLARVRRNLAAEQELRERGREAFAPIEAEVRAAVAEVEVGRIFDHAHALYQFDSKFMTQLGNRLAIEYLANTLRQMGYEPELQWFEPRPGVRTANVVATLRGTTSPDRITVISSHFDSVEPSPGADDNSSGTTALLEAARVLASRPQPGTIQFAFLTAEEAGLLGAYEFVRRAQAAGARIVNVINNDMVGWTRSHRLDNTIRYSNARTRDIQHAAAILFTELITYDSRYVRNTDAHVFYDAYGDIIGGIGSYPILGNPHYHQRHDTLEAINHRLVAEVSRATIATVMRLARN